MTSPPLPDARVAHLWRVRTLLALLRCGLGQQGMRDAQGDMAVWLTRHPVLQSVLDDAAEAGLADLTLDEGLAQLDALLLAPTLDAHSALGRLRRALGLDAHGLSAWVAAALADEDPRLADFIDALHGQGGRVTRATLVSLCGAQTAALALQALRHAHCLREDDPRNTRTWTAHPALWALACGLPPPPGTWRHLPHAQLPRLDELILPDAWLQRLQAPPSLSTPSTSATPSLAASAAAAASPDSGVCWLLRGGPGNGRHSLAAALAQSAGLGLVSCVDDASHALPMPGEPHGEPHRGPAHGALFTAAVLLGAMPLLNLTPDPGERLHLPAPPLRLPHAPGQLPQLAVRLPRHGGVAMPGWDTRQIDMAPPDARERRQHWQRALAGHGGAHGPDIDPQVLGLRLPRGTLHRVARAVGRAAMPAVMAQLEAQGRFALDGIAQRMPNVVAPETLALPADTQDEFDALVSRCRHRDALAEALPAALGHASGVRALFKGASGTGKTLAARHLAAALGRPLYRVDLAATVSKYIGETERNLERVFEAAESLDIVLLLDEGDALLAGRTQVSNATDRYANHETNYLLQRLEHYSGVLVVTTNAAERIDTAFARRMDVTLDFPLPDALTRLALWQAHLGLTLGETLAPPLRDGLERVALRCTLSGGQIRNAALHATLLALDGSGRIGPHELRLALEREYRKVGQQCPSLDEVF